jgi:hypothetical protein
MFGVPGKRLQRDQYQHDGDPQRDEKVFKEFFRKNEAEKIHDLFIKIT